MCVNKDSCEIQLNRKQLLLYFGLTLVIGNYGTKCSNVRNLRRT